MKKIIENKKTGVRGYVVNEGEKITININGEEKTYTVGSFKKMFKVVEIIEEQVEEEVNLTKMEKEFIYAMRNNCYSDILESNGEWLFAVTDELSYSEQQAKGVESSLVKKGIITTEYQEDDGDYIVAFTKKGEEIASNPEYKEVKVEEVANNEAKVEEEQVDIKEVEEVEVEDVAIEEKIEAQPTLQDKVITLIKEFVDNPNFNTNQTEMEYVERATISKVTLNKKNLIEIDIQKKAVVIYFNKSTLSENNVNRMTKLIPDSYGWTSNALFKVVSESQLELLQDMLVETREGKLKLDKQKAEESRLKQEKLEQERLEKAKQRELKKQEKMAQAK